MDQFMSLLPIIIPALVLLGLLVVPAVKIVYQYQRGVLFRFGRLVGVRKRESPSSRPALVHFCQV